MTYDFDKVINRRGTDSEKWDILAPNELPMWVADMDFEVAQPIRDAIQKRLDQGVYGYSFIPDRWAESYINWWRNRHQYTMEADWLIFSTGVIPSMSSIVRKLTTPAEKVVFLTPVYNIFYNSVLNNGRVVSECQLIPQEDGTYAINWEDLERNQDQYCFTRHMIRIRKAHPVLRKKTEPCSLGFADISVYEPEESTRALRILYAGKFEDGEDDLVFVVVNPYWEEQACLLPPLPEHMYWQVEANTQEGWYLQKCVYGRDMPDHQPVPVREPVVNAAPRSVMVLTPGKM